MKQNKKDKKLYHTDELFRLIDGALKEKGLRPDILDYGLETSEHRPVKTITWDTIGRVNFGESEGIYLDLWLEGDIGAGKAERVALGTYKTLRDDKEAFKTMAILHAEFVFALRDLVNGHMDDFNWIGYDIHFYREGKKVIGYGPSRDLDSAKTLIHEQFRRYHYDYAILINNETGEEERYENDEQNGCATGQP